MQVEGLPCTDGDPSHVSIPMMGDLRVARRPPRTPNLYRKILRGSTFTYVHGGNGFDGLGVSAAVLRGGGTGHRRLRAVAVGVIAEVVLRRLVEQIIEAWVVVEVFLVPRGVSNSETELS